MSALCFWSLVRASGKRRRPRCGASGFALVLLLTAVFSPIGRALASDDGGRGRAIALLEKCLENQAATDRVSMRVLKDMTFVYQSRSWPRHQTDEFLFQRDGDKLDLAGRYLYFERLQDQSYQYGYVINSDLYVGYNLDFHRFKTPQSGLFSREPPVRFAALIRDHGGILDGYILSGARRAADQMQNAPDLQFVGSEVIGGTECSVVRAHIAHGTITLWIAEPLRFVVLKATGDRGLSDLDDRGQSLGADPSRFYVNGKVPTKVVGVSVVVDNVRAARRDDYYVPIGARVTETMRLEGTELTNVYTTEYKRSDIDLHPDFAKSRAFVSDLPNGAGLTNLDDPKSGVAYEWRDGAVVKAYTSAAAQGVTMAPTGQTVWRTLLWCAAALILAACGAWMIYRFRAAVRD